MGVLREFDKLHAVFQIGLIRALVPLNIPQAPILLSSPLSGHLLVKRGVDGAVQLIDIGGVDAVLEPVVFGAQALDRGFVLASFVGVALVQSVADPVKDFVVEGHAAQQRRELLFEHLLAHIGLVAIPFVAGAMIVDVAPLLDLADHRAAAVAAGDQSRKCEIVLHPTVFAGIPAVQHILHTLPKLAGDQRLMAALVEPAVPFELAHVEPVAQDLVHRAGRNRLAALAVAETVYLSLFREIAQRQPTRGVPFEHAGDMRRHVRVGLNHPLAVGAVGVAIAERGGRGPYPLLGLLQHALARLFREVVDVVLGHQHLDAVHELLGRSRVAGQHRPLLDQVYLDIQLVEQHPVLEIAIQPICLLDQQHAHRGVGPQTSDHLTEGGAAGLLCGLNVHVFLRDREALRRRVFLEKLQLRRNREALLLLLLGGNAGVDHRLLARGFGGGTGLQGLCHSV